jgi:hypothetical protein
MVAGETLLLGFFPFSSLRAVTNLSMVAVVIVEILPGEHSRLKCSNAFLVTRCVSSASRGRMVASYSVLKSAQLFAALILIDAGR